MQRSGTIAAVTGAHLATFLIRHRSRIDALMSEQLGGAAPEPASAEAELLRRFRSCAAAALASGRPAEPALEGLRVNDRRASALLDGWIGAAAVAGAPARRRDPGRAAPDPAGVRRAAAPDLGVRARRAAHRARSGAPSAPRSTASPTASSRSTPIRAASSMRIRPRARCSASRATRCSASTRWRSCRPRVRLAGGPSSTRWRRAASRAASSRSSRTSAAARSRVVQHHAACHARAHARARARAAACRAARGYPSRARRNRPCAAQAVRGGLGPVRLDARVVHERVAGTGHHHHLRRRARARELALERCHVRERDEGVLIAEEREHRAAQLRSPSRSARAACSRGRARPGRAGCRGGARAARRTARPRRSRGRSSAAMSAYMPPMQNPTTPTRPFDSGRSFTNRAASRRSSSTAGSEIERIHGPGSPIFTGARAAVEVDREHREARVGEPRRERARVAGEPPDVVDHHDARARARRRPAPRESPARPPDTSCRYLTTSTRKP